MPKTTKKVTKKTPDKPKKAEGPNRKKPTTKKRTPSSVIKSANEARRRAVQRAAAQLRRFAIPFDLGDSIIICTRHKVMLAFDHPEDSMEGLRKNAAASGSILVHFDASTFKHTELFDVMVIDAIDRKPMYAGTNKGMVPPVKVPDLAKRIKRTGRKLSAKQNNKTRTKKVEKISRRHLTR